MTPPVPLPAPDRRWLGVPVLVTGGAGFIGGHLVRALAAAGADVHVLDPAHGPDSPLWMIGGEEDAHLAEGRLERYDDVRAAIADRGIETVFHLGAQTLVGVARRDPLPTFEANVRGTAHVLEACRVIDTVRGVVVASSDKAYGDCAELPYTEPTPLAGRFPYDVSKSCTDLLTRSYAETYGLPVAIARCGNVYGPGDLHWSRLVPGAIRALCRGERPVIRSDGTPLRDYLFVADAVAAYLALVRWLDEDGNAAERGFNFSAGEPMTVLEMTRHLRMATGREDLEPLIEGTARDEIAAQHLDSTRARCELGWRAEADLERSLFETVLWYRAHLNAPELAAAAPSGAER